MTDVSKKTSGWPDGGEDINGWNLNLWKGVTATKPSWYSQMKRTKRTLSIQLSLSLLQQQEVLGPLSPSSTCSLTHCQLTFPWGAQRGQRVHRRTARHWLRRGERFNSPWCSASTGMHDYTSFSFKIETYKSPPAYKINRTGRHLLLKHFANCKIKVQSAVTHFPLNFNGNTVSK